MENFRGYGRAIVTRCKRCVTGHEWFQPEPEQLLEGYTRTRLSAWDWTTAGDFTGEHFSSDRGAPLLCPKGDPPELVSYDPTRDRRLLDRFLGLPYKIEQQAEFESAYLAFADRYGLFEDQMLGFNSPGCGTRYGESVRYWREQVCILARLNQVYEALKLGTPESVDDLELWTEKSIMPRLSNRVFRYEELESDGFRHHADLLDRHGVLTRAQRVRATAYHLLYAEVNKRCAHLVTPAVDPFGSQIQLVAANLLGAVYVQFIYRMMGKPRPIKFCAREGCDEIVVRQRRSAKYCSIECQELQKEYFRLARQAARKQRR